MLRKWWKSTKICFKAYIEGSISSKATNHSALEEYGHYSGTMRTSISICARFCQDTALDAHAIEVRQPGKRRHVARVRVPPFWMQTLDPGGRVHEQKRAPTTQHCRGPIPQRSAARRERWSTGIDPGGVLLNAATYLQLYVEICAIDGYNA